MTIRLISGPRAANKKEGVILFLLSSALFAGCVFHWTQAVWRKVCYVSNRCYMYGQIGDAGTATYILKISEKKQVFRVNPDLNLIDRPNCRSND